MKIERYEDTKATETHVRLWLEKKGFPKRIYEKLSSYHKDLLHKLVCTPTQPTTYTERKDLYKKLCLPDIAGRWSIDPVDFMPDEKRRKFFSPLTPSEKLHHLEKF